jgi:diketogulonate reductase-like aldo/keto reductase
MDINSKFTLNTGVEIPIIGLGTWELTKQTSDIVQMALGIGYPIIDTSGNYDVQPAISEGIQKSGFERSTFYLQTKVEPDENTYSATITNLKELQMPYANMLILHWPPKNGFGEEQWKGLIKAKEDGLTKDIGVSNYSVEQIQGLIDATGVKPAINQIEWTPFGHDKSVLGYCQENEIIIQSYSPLTRGERLDDKTLTAIANKHDVSPSQVLIRWNLQQGIIPIIKGSTEDHLKDNINVFSFELSDKEMESLDGLNEQYSSLHMGPLPYIKNK